MHSIFFSFFWVKIWVLWLIIMFATGNNVHLWNLLQAIYFAAWEWYWSQLAWAKSESMWCGCALLAKGYQLWPNYLFRCVTVCCFTVFFADLKIGIRSGTNRASILLLFALFAFLRISYLFIMLKPLPLLLYCCFLLLFWMLSMRMPLVT